MPVKTTHVGSLPRTPQLLEANNLMSAGKISPQQFEEIIERASAEVVAKQRVLILSMRASTDTLPRGRSTMAPGGTILSLAWGDLLKPMRIVGQKPRLFAPSLAISGLLLSLTGATETYFAKPMKIRTREFSVTATP